MCARPKIANAANTHLVWLLFVSWATYAYRDLYPFATFTLIPLDISEGWFIWAKIGVLSFAGLVIPLGVPTHYVPFNLKVRKRSAEIWLRLEQLLPGSRFRAKSRANCLLVLLVILFLFGSSDHQGLHYVPFSRLRVSARCRL